VSISAEKNRKKQKKNSTAKPSEDCVIKKNHKTKTKSVNMEGMNAMEIATSMSMLVNALEVQAEEQRWETFMLEANGSDGVKKMSAYCKEIKGRENYPHAFLHRMMMLLCQNAGRLGIQRVGSIWDGLVDDAMDDEREEWDWTWRAEPGGRGYVYYLCSPAYVTDAEHRCAAMELVTRMWQLPVDNLRKVLWVNEEELQWVIDACLHEDVLPPPRAMPPREAYPFQEMHAGTRVMELVKVVREYWQTDQAAVRGVETELGRVMSAMAREEGARVDEVHAYLSREYARYGMFLYAMATVAGTEYWATFAASAGARGRFRWLLQSCACEPSYDLALMLLQGEEEVDVNGRDEEGKGFAYYLTYVPEQRSREVYPVLLCMLLHGLKLETEEDVRQVVRYVFEDRMHCMMYGTYPVFWLLVQMLTHPSLAFVRAYVTREYGGWYPLLKRALPSSMSARRLTIRAVMCHVWGASEETSEEFVARVCGEMREWEDAEEEAEVEAGMEVPVLVLPTMAVWWNSSVVPWAGGR
jgi:hypothetical protein